MAYTFPDMPTPGSDAGSWGTKLNALLTFIKSTLNALNADKAAAGHDHDEAYSAIDHNHNVDYAAAIHNHNDDYAAAIHNHHVSDITDMASVFVTLTNKSVNAPTVNYSGATHATVKVLLSLVDTAVYNNIFEWHLTAKWSHPDNPSVAIITEDIAYMSSQIILQKPAADSAVWSAAGKAVLKLTAHAVNLFNGTQSNNSPETSAEISVFSLITAADIADTIINDATTLSSLVHAIAADAALGTALKAALQETT